MPDDGLKCQLHCSGRRIFEIASDDHKLCIGKTFII